MLVSEAIRKGRKKIGVAADTPSLLANSVLQLWTNAVSDSASVPAFTCLGQTLSYGETDQLARRVATFFQKELKLKPGDRIAVQLPNIIQYPVVVIAALKLGLIIVNVNPMYSTREIVHQFNDANVKTVVVLDQFYETVKNAAPETNIKNIIVTRPIDLLPSIKQQILTLAMKALGKRPVIRDKNVIWFKTLLKSGASYSTYRSSIDDVFALQYTGGTTGVSKGVKLTQKSLLANVAQCLDVIKINNDFLYCSTTISPLPLYHIYAYALCFGILPAIRGHSVLIPDPRNTASFVKVLKKNKFDIFHLTGKAEWDTLLFFYGILVCVGGLAALGYLKLISDDMYVTLGATYANILVGFLSAIIVNIPIVYAVLTAHPEMDMGQWLLITLTAGVGGSLLSIGSAAGVALMGQARGIYTFFSHLKWSWAILLGYAASVVVHLWLNADLFDLVPLER